MVPIARRNLLADKVKLLVAVGGVTLAVVLIVVVHRLYQGVRRETDIFIHNLPGDIWITQRGTTDLVFSNSNLPSTAASAVRSVDEVKRVYTLDGRLMAFDVNGKEVRTYVMALEFVGGAGEPEGTEYVPEKGTIILDHTFAKQTGLHKGDKLTFGDKSFKVADVRSIGNVLVTQFAFIRAESFKEIFGVPGTVNYILVKVDDGVAPESILQKLADTVPGSSVYTTQQFASRASEKGTGDFLPIIRVILAISFIVGLTVLSLVIYSATIERAREYAIKILVKVDDGVAPESILQKLADTVPGSSVYTTQQFASRASEKGTGDFLPIIRVILAISFIVGLTVLSLVIYSATIERAREYAIMKVIGASPLGLYRIVISQSMFIAVVGFGLGVALAFLL